MCSEARREVAAPLYNPFSKIDRTLDPAQGFLHANSIPTFSPPRPCFPLHPSPSPTCSARGRNLEEAGGDELVGVNAEHGAAPAWQTTAGI